MSTLIEAERAYDDEVIGEDTIAEAFEAAASRHESRPAQYYKGGIYDRSLVGPVLEAAPDGEFRSITYADMRDIVQNLAAGFRAIGLTSEDRVAMFAHTRMEWAQSDFALLAAGATVTTVYPTSSPRQLTYLLNHPGATGVVLENRDLFDRFLSIEDDLDSIEWVVVIDSLGDHPAGERDDVYTLADIHNLGASDFSPEAYRSWLDEQTLDDLASIIYTSGTTGPPKGVLLTHGNFRANVNQIRRRFGPRSDKPADTGAITEETRVVSYLPLAHVFERLAGHFVMFLSGSSVAYAESPDTLQEDFELAEPTSATSVPRVYEQMYREIRKQAQSSPIKAKIFNWATGVGEEFHKADDPGAWLRFKRSIADTLVFSTVREALGGQLEFMISGGGSLSADLNALYHGMGLPILEGYGLTETSPVLTANPPEAPQIGTIGPALVDVETKLDSEVQLPDDVSTDGTVGELLVKGPNVTQGYLDNPEANAEAMTDDGWFRTGDIVEKQPDGYFVFQERLKELLVLTTGKNVAPVPIEDEFATSRLVEQCMIVGDNRPFVTALLVPSFEDIQEWSDEQGFDVPADPQGICEHLRVRSAIADEIEAVNEDLESYEQIEDFALVPEEFTEENDLLTPTLKKKRRNILDRFSEEIEELYADA